MDIEQNREHFHKIINEINKNIKVNLESLDFYKMNDLIEKIVKIYASNRMIFIYGAGRSGFIGRCFAQRLMHLGIKSCFISDAITYQYTKNDLLLLISGSGETTSTVAIAQKAKEIGGTIILFTANSMSSIARISNLIIEILGKSKDKALLESTYAPYTTLFDISAFSILDSIAGVLMKILGVTEGDINKRHASIE
ncbi:MAG: SIS domain-containing protein [Candidatus Thorarchaeota archaeon]